MSYQNATDLLPKEIIEQVQKYADGQTIYIPRKESNKKQWGENTDTKQTIAFRNRCIYLDFEKGMNIKQLAEKYFLVEKSIQRILRQENS